MNFFDSFYLFPFNCRPYVKHGCTATTQAYHKEKLIPIIKKLIKFVCKVAFLTQIIIIFVYFTVNKQTMNHDEVQPPRDGRRQLRLHLSE